MNDYLKQMGISEEDFENAYDAMFDENGNPDPSLLGQMGFQDITNGFDPEDNGESPDDDDNGEELFQKGGAGTMPDFFRKLFGSAGGEKNAEKSADGASPDKKEKKKEKTDKKRRNLETYCTNLTRRAKDGKIDRIIGRDKEISRVIQIL